jgi:hypothetical protein
LLKTRYENVWSNDKFTQKVLNKNPLNPKLLRPIFNRSKNFEQ